MNELHYLYGKPKSSADFKVTTDDFRVDEILGFELSGEGEHVCLQIVKKGENTPFVAKKIAKIAQTHVRNVSYAGLKDRNGICSQWFSVPVPIKKEIDFSSINSESIVLLQQKRHNKKLRTGCHKANKFIICLRNLSEPLDVLARINAVRQGVPNYFGPQRFGRDGHNLEMAKKLFSGEKIHDRKLRSIVISAARSYVFNEIVSRRVALHGLATTLTEEVFLLSGSNAFFKEPISVDTVNRLAQGDLHLSAPLIGRGDDALTAEELTWLSTFSLWRNGLIELGLKTERRNLRLYPQELQVEQAQQNSITLSFTLAKGTFATSVLRELAICTDVSIKKQIKEENENLTQ